MPEIIINNSKENIPYLPFETTTLFTKRLATKYNTLPEYLYVDPPFSSDSETKNTVIDLLNLIKEDGKKNTELSVFLENNQKYITPDQKTNIILTWLSFAELLRNEIKKHPFALESVYSTVEDIFDEDQKKFQAFWDSKDQFIKNINNSISINKIISEKINSLSSELEKLDPVIYTEVEIEQSTITFKIKLQEIEYNLTELFNKIVLNNIVPFAYYNSYYKLVSYPGMISNPPLDWRFTVPKDNNVLLLKLNEKNSEIIENDINIDYDSDLFENVEIVQQGGEFICTLKLKRYKKTLAKESSVDIIKQNIKKILDIFPELNISYSDISENDIVGVYYMPELRVDSYVLSDLIMNNSLVSNFLLVNESSKTTKKKTDVGSWLHILSTEERVSIGLTQKIVSNNDDFGEDKSLFDVGSPYVRIRIMRGDNLDDITKFQELFAKMLTKYLDEYKNIVNAYRKFLPDFGKYEKSDEVAEKQLDKNVFVKKYSRNCNIARIPIELDGKIDENDPSILKFPRDKLFNNSPWITAYNSDGINQRYYTCPNKEFPYPGLQVNKLNNSGDYPFVPCCFKYDQTKKIGREYRHYYFNEELMDKKIGHKNLITTDKFVNTKSMGELPIELSSIFMSLDPKYKYYRTGSVIGINSLIHAIMNGISADEELNNLSTEQIKSVLKHKRRDLTKTDIINISKQSNYDKSIEDIKTNLSANKTYLDPRLYSQILGEYFKCNMIVFDKKGIILPRYTDGWYSFKHDRPYIFIYENWGSESDHADNPQCELIVKQRSEKVHSLFSNNSIIDLYNNILMSYSMNRIIQPIDTLSFTEGVLTHQYIDSRGKTRKLMIDYKGKTIIINTEPLPIFILPLLVEEEKGNEDIQTIFEFIEANGIKVLSRSSTTITGVYKNIRIEFVFQKEQNNNMLMTYNNNKRMARYLTEYGLWMFSRYLNEKKLSEITDKTLKQFYESRIKVIKNVEYKNVNRTFSESSSFIDDGYLAVPSEETAKRLLYYIKIYSLRDVTGLIEYYNRQTIREYILDITDFKDYKNQIILFGSSSYEKWITRGKDYDQYLYDHPRLDQKYPYFFMNKLISNEIFLAQNTFSFENAVDICKSWDSQHYNKGGFALDNEKSISGVEFYTTTHANDIRLITQQTMSRNKILAFKHNNETFYTVLLKLE